MKVHFGENSIGFGGFLLIAGMFYNACLAIVNAHGMAISQAHVSIVEIFIVFLGLAYAGLKIGKFPNVLPPLLFILSMTCLMAFVSIVNEHFIIKSIRDMLLIFVFFMVGGLSSEKNLIYSFRVITVSVFAVMVVEAYMTETYVAIFQPMSYFTNTRGIEELSVDSSGLFRNALGYEGRFSLSFLSDHRLSSLFLEQVSLANFCMVLAVFTSSFWSKLSRFEKFFYILLILFIIVTNSTRTGIAVCFAILIGHFIFPHMPRYSNVFYMPLILMAGALLFYDPNYDVTRMTDDLPGRIGRTMYHLSTMGIDHFVGGSLYLINHTFDSGYTYIIATLTIFGLIIFWLFASLIVPPINGDYKRFIHASAVYIFVNLVIGSALFSIKVSAPLWFMAGYLYYRRYAETPAGILYGPRIAQD